MTDEKVVGLRFQELRYRVVVRTHLSKAYETKPHDVDALFALIQRIMDAGPLLNGCQQAVTRLAHLDTKGGKRWFAAVSVGSLVALVRWDHRCFTILAVIDLDRLAHRDKQRQCYVVDFEVDTDGQHLPIALFIDSQNHIVCCTMPNWENGEITSLHFDPWSGRKQGSAVVAS